jgi:hypothetical protein
MAEGYRGDFVSPKSGAVKPQLFDLQCAVLLGVAASLLRIIALPLRYCSKNLQYEQSDRTVSEHFERVLLDGTMNHPVPVYVTSTHRRSPIGAGRPPVEGRDPLYTHMRTRTREKSLENLTWEGVVDPPG